VPQLSCTRLPAGLKLLLTLGNGLPAQVGVPITRLPLQCYLSRGQSMGSQGVWIRTACVQKARLQREGYRGIHFYRFCYSPDINY